MKWIKLFEDFKQNNEEGTLITQDDIINCIKKEELFTQLLLKNIQVMIQKNQYHQLI